MKKTILFVFISTMSINAEINTDMIYDAMGKGIKDLGSSVVKNADNLIRRATNTRTKEQKCNSKWFALQKKSSKYYWDTYKENIKMERILTKRHINYRVILNQSIEKKINLSKLKSKACSEKYFDLSLRRKKEDNKIGNKNKILKDLIKKHGLHIFTKSIYERTKVTKEYKNISETIIAKKNLKEQMKRAIKEMD